MNYFKGTLVGLTFAAILFLFVGCKMIDPGYNEANDWNEECAEYQMMSDRLHCQHGRETAEAESDGGGETDGY